MMRFVIFFLFCGFAADHPIHISSTDCYLDVDNKRFQWSQSIFIDDLELALQEYSDSLFLGTPFEHDSAEIFIRQYLEENVSVIVNDHEVPLKLIGKERSEDYAALWVYLEGELPKKAKRKYSLDLKNTVLLEVYDDQKNLLNFSDSKERTFFTSFDQRNFFRSTSFDQ